MKLLKQMSETDITDPKIQEALELAYKDEIKLTEQLVKSLTVEYVK